MSILRTTVGLASLAASVSAHGYVQGIVADGTYYQGYSPSFQYQQTPPSVPGWSDPKNLGNGYVAPDALADPDIICHLSATPGTAAATVAAGGKVELQWTTWPDSHHGPVLDYLAPVSAENWSDVDKTALSFVKISEGGLIDDSSAPGTWASDQLISNNNSWVVNIPTSVAPGKYVLRHEIIALHSAGQEDGAQMYPQCVNLEITGSGTTSIEGGEAATSFYKKDDAGILINIYTTGIQYQIPGPTLWSGAAAAATQTGVSAPGYATASSVASSTSVTAQNIQKAQATAKSSVFSCSSTTATAHASATTAKTSGTANVYVKATNSVTVAAAAPYSAIAGLASAIPSEALTSKIPAYSAAPLPTGGQSGSDNGTVQWGDLPSKSLPEGWSLLDLLQWVAYLLQQSWTQGDQRNHARDFKEASDVKLFKSFVKAIL